MAANTRRGTVCGVDAAPSRCTDTIPSVVLTLFRRNITQGTQPVEDTQGWRIGSCCQLGLSIREMTNTGMNESWREEWIFLAQAAAVQGGGRRGKRLEEVGR